MKAGIMGGTFDPIHLGHLAVAEAVRESEGLDRVIFVPAGVPPHRQPPVAAPEHRLRMVRLAVAGNPGFTVCDWEVNRTEPAYTINTVRHLARQLGPGAEIQLILGLDAFGEIGAWHQVTQLVREISFLVIDRPGAPPPGNLPAGVTYRRVAAGRFAISAREIRGRVGENRSIRYLVPEPVRAYIGRQGLYRRAGGHSQGKDPT